MFKQFWGSMNMPLPGMMAPTLDTDELDKRIADLKAVEGWLKMNLNMLQMSIQGLEMQKVTLAAVKAMSQSSSEEGQPNPFASAAMNPALWAWNFMAPGAEAAQAAASETAVAPKGKNGKGGE
ncbi:MAG TPA: PhaM family polyhydroxyalkanoate granule multifunctional regulatory protein [Rhodocyclaceae bacterium]|nr:PhaM family polyhydroxyalkanoate granule multifunctional regulatory protein [Rhodocyclaceae bacterium]